MTAAQFEIAYLTADGWRRSPAYGEAEAHAKSARYERVGWRTAVIVAGSDLPASRHDLLAAGNIASLRVKGRFVYLTDTNYRPYAPAGVIIDADGLYAYRPIGADAHLELCATPDEAAITAAEFHKARIAL